MQEGTEINIYRTILLNSIPVFNPFAQQYVRIIRNIKEDCDYFFAYKFKFRILSDVHYIFAIIAKAISLFLFIVLP